jgi:hypothetical protein
VLPGDLPEHLPGAVGLADAIEAIEHEGILAVRAIPKREARSNCQSEQRSEWQKRNLSLSRREIPRFSGDEAATSAADTPIPRFALCGRASASPSKEFDCRSRGPVDRVTWAGEDDHRDSESAVSQGRVEGG